MRVIELSFKLIALGVVEACWWGKQNEPEERRIQKPPVRPKTVPRGNPKVSISKRKGIFPKGKGPKKGAKKGAKKGKKRPPPPPPKEFVGERPTWQSVSQKGKVCVGTSSAAVPCKDPIKMGAKCDEKFQWSTDGYIQSIVHCNKNPKGGVIRKELRQECNLDNGVLMCWQHWSTTGCHDDTCQSDKLGNGMGPPKS